MALSGGLLGMQPSAPGSIVRAGEMQGMPQIPMTPDLWGRIRAAMMEGGRGMGSAMGMPMDPNSVVREGEMPGMPTRDPSSVVREGEMNPLSAFAQTMFRGAPNMKRPGWQNAMGGIGRAGLMSLFGGR